MREPSRPPQLGGPLVLGVLALATGLALVLGGSTVEAQTPTNTPTPLPVATVTDAQQLAVEQQLLCPLCVNERLDVCTLAICADMKQQIHEQLAAGRNPDDIILFFSTRYGPKVRAELPRQGFNLVLFGWVGAAVVLAALGAAYALYTMRRDTLRRRLVVAAPVALSAAPATSSGDDRWVDDLLEEARTDDSGTAPPGTR